VGITIPDCKVQYRAVEIKTSWYWHKNKYDDLWNIIEDPDIKSHIYAHLIFDKATKNILQRKDSHFNKCCGEN
jgi:uncharacterized protein (DUF736 family)